MNTRVCLGCSAPFLFDNDEAEFRARFSYRRGSLEIALPPPTLCPPCRSQRRLAWRNHVHVNLHPSSTTGKTIFSSFYEPLPFPVIANEEWWGGTLDPIQFGRPVDFSQSFFEQWRALRRLVPHPSLSTLNMENSDYCNNVGQLKNCYLVFNSNYAEECLYCEGAWYSRDCIDCTRVPNSELCYDCTACERCYRLQSSQFCSECSDSYFLVNCRGCKNCYGCANLRRQKYCIFNQKVSREEYLKFIAGLRLDLYHERQQRREEAEQFLSLQPRPHIVALRQENVTGNLITGGKDLHECFVISDGEHLRYCFGMEEGSKDCLDTSLFGIHSELLFECSTCGINSVDLKGCFDCWDGCSNLSYCEMCPGCSDCFGCVGLPKKQYCILNKQYSEQEYHELVSRIIALMQSHREWGEFFPLSYAPFPYNVSLAQRYFPLTKDETLSRGLRWYEKETSDLAHACNASDLQDGLPQDTNPRTVRSALSGKPFKITTRELISYEKLSVPLPRITYLERIEARARFLGGITLYTRICAKSGKELFSPYAPDAPFPVWDKDVYEQEFS